MSDTPDFDAAAATTRVRKTAPEPLQEHWADIDGVLYPPKQAYHLITGQPRSEFNTHHALAQLHKYGFATSTLHAQRSLGHDSCSRRGRVYS